MSDLQTLRRLERAERTLERLQTVERPMAGGTAFPSTPPTGFLFYRTDLGWLCYYDGTRWLTVHEYEAAFFAGDSIDFTANNASAMIVRNRTDYAPYVTRVALTSRVITTNDANNFWSIVFVGYNLSFGSFTTLVTYTTATDTVNAYTTHESALTVAPANNTHFSISITKAGAAANPGTLRLLPAIFYRLIVT